MKTLKATKKLTMTPASIDLDTVVRTTFGMIKQCSKDKELWSNVVHFTKKLKDVAAFAGLEKR
jgi:hypothetical protein